MLLRQTRCGARCDIQIARLVVSLESKEARGYMNKPKDWPWFIVLGCVLPVKICAWLKLQWPEQVRETYGFTSNYMSIWITQENTHGRPKQPIRILIGDD